MTNLLLPQRFHKKLYSATLLLNSTINESKIYQNEPKKQRDQQKETHQKKSTEKKSRTSSRFIVFSRATLCQLGGKKQGGCTSGI